VGELYYIKKTKRLANSRIFDNTDVLEYKGFNRVNDNQTNQALSGLIFSNGTHTELVLLSKLQNISNLIIPGKEINKSLPKIFSLSNILISNINNNIHSINKENYKSLINTADYYKYDDLAVREEILKHLEENNELYIPSFDDIDIRFKRGDQVSFADWNNPINMHKKFYITDFIFDKEKNTLSIEIKDTVTGAYENVPYIYFERGEINLHSLKKSYDTHGTIFSGCKIKAKVTKIPNFPKKDTNQIITFIDRSSEQPLVLLSNLCTLNIEDLKLFDIYSPDHPKWNKMICLDLNSSLLKLKNMQQGDFFMDFLNDKLHSVTYLYIRYNLFHQFNSGQEINNKENPQYYKESHYCKQINKIRLGFLNPRKTKKPNEINNIFE
jgi:hypothetical protein